MDGPNGRYLYISVAAFSFGHVLPCPPASLNESCKSINKRSVHYVAGETIMSRRHLAIGKRQRSQSLVPLRANVSESVSSRHVMDGPNGI